MTGNNQASRAFERNYTARRSETDVDVSRLSEESQAALRQYSLERTMGYGTDYSDAVELRAKVLGGAGWQSAATELAERCLSYVDRARGSAGAPTRISYLRRASALLRLSQAMMLADTEERRRIFARAAELYGDAALLARDCRSVRIESKEGPVCGWLHESGNGAVGSVLVIGGVEGWAMDFACMGHAFAARGIDALLLDGPGQGETRFAHGHYLSTDWRNAYERAVDFLDERAPGRPIGFVGNSMGGSFAMAVANADRRIRVCVNNGGPIAPWMVPQNGTFFEKMMAAADVTDKAQAVKIWSTVPPAEKGLNDDYALLLIHGREDPLISNVFAEMLFKGAPTRDKEMVNYSDGDHCIYRHLNDRDALISDWVRDRLSGQIRSESTGL